MSDMKRFVRDRDEAFIDFVETGNTDKVRKYCRKYGVPMPKDKKCSQQESTKQFSSAPTFRRKSKIRLL